MSNLNIIIICSVLACIALFIVSFINAQQTRKRLISQRLLQLKRKVAELEELAVALEPLTGSIALEKVILEDTADMLKGMLQLSPESQSVEFSLESALQKITEISGSGYTTELNRIMESDAGVARAQYLLGEAGRIVKKRQVAGQLELSVMTSYIEELAWAHMMVAVVTLTGQGHRSVRSGDVMRGYAFYKKAQQVAIEGNVTDDRRHLLIKELGEMMSNKRKSLSTLLMPETSLNPSETPEPQAK